MSDNTVHPDDVMTLVVKTAGGVVEYMSSGVRSGQVLVRARWTLVRNDAVKFTKLEAGKMIDALNRWDASHQKSGNAYATQPVDRRQS